MLVEPRKRAQLPAHGWGCGGCVDQDLAARGYPTRAARRACHHQRGRSQGRGRERSALRGHTTDSERSAEAPRARLRTCAPAPGSLVSVPLARESPETRPVHFHAANSSSASTRSKLWRSRRVARTSLKAARASRRPDHDRPAARSRRPCRRVLGDDRPVTRPAQSRTPPRPRPPPPARAPCTPATSGRSCSG